MATRVDPTVESKEYTQEEINALPQTTQVFDDSKLNIDFQKHQWIQQGYHIIEQCHGGQIAMPIPVGKMLIRKNGRYDLVDEVRN